MALTTEFVPLELKDLRRQAAVLKADGWRFIQTHAANGEQGVDLYYSFMKDGHIDNYRIAGVTKDMAVPSITDLFLAAFVFENEARELFGVDMRDIAIDFQGAMYAPAQNEPMTFITPEQKAAKEKAAKVAAAKAAKAAKESDGKPSSEGAAAAESTGKRVFVMTPERQARLDAKLATMSPDKVAKVKAALKEREAEAQAASGEPAQTSSAQAGKAEPPAVKAGPDTPAKTAEVSAAELNKDTVLEQKIALLGAEKAAKVRAALSGGVAPAEQEATGASSDGSALDSQLEHLIGLMDKDSAATVRAALARKGGE